MQENAFKVIAADFVTISSGTGIVHIAPTFGADDSHAAAKANVPGLLVLDEQQNPVPLVDQQGRFRVEMGEFAGKYVKNEYYSQPPQKSVDVEIAIKLKKENKAFRVEKYSHSYPHCWRTDKPVLYYPLESWFIRTSDYKERMQELNHTINWKPSSTGSGRFGKWLENLTDWNLSRSRFWGIPIPIWTTKEGDEQICICSLEMLYAEIEKAVCSGVMETNPLNKFVVGDMSAENYSQIDLHKNIVDDIVLVSENGKPMYREPDLIDVWFDSGAMPYAQLHYPFENKDLFDTYPADFIAEGVDQTRGWFYTLHAISTMIFDSVAFKNVVSNGLVLDKNGQKMSKRLGNAIDPFVVLEKYGPDPTRWYMISNSQPWDNLKFNDSGITETINKFFGTLYNSYSFFATYANIADYSHDSQSPATDTVLDRWVLSKLYSLIDAVDNAYTDYEPTKAARLIQEFVIDQLSNWYLRLCRHRYSANLRTTVSSNPDQKAAFYTLYTCLKTVAVIGSPIAPFYMDQLYQDLTGQQSVHTADYPEYNSLFIDHQLETKMELVQYITSTVLALRNKAKLKTRQPLQQIAVLVSNQQDLDYIDSLKELILSETNVKELKILDNDNTLIVKSIKPVHKSIGPRYGKYMKKIVTAVNEMNADDIFALEKRGEWSLTIDDQTINLYRDDFLITAKDIPGWSVGGTRLTVALDTRLSATLLAEGIAREFVSHVQNVRKEIGLRIADNIVITVDTTTEIKAALQANENYVYEKLLAKQINYSSVEQDTVILNIVNVADTKIVVIKY